MRKIIGIICTILFLALFVCLAHSKEIYKVNVRKIGDNLYKDYNSGIIIQTRYCYEYVYGEDAILVWDGEYGDNKLIFDDDTCEVRTIIR